MPSTLLAPARPVSLRQPWPRLTRCRCGAPVLTARSPGRGGVYILDPSPILPEGVCGQCEGRGRVAVATHAGTITRISATMRTVAPGDLAGVMRMLPAACPNCDGSGLRGEPVIVGVHVIVAADGVARPFTGDREAWEAAHARHHCQP